MTALCRFGWNLDD